MRSVFGLLSIVIVMAIGMYIYSKQAQSSSALAGANNPKAAINITGVKADLVSIASAERRYFASEGKYASFDELISSNSITVARQRPPYTYDVQTSSSGFRVVATRSGDDTSGTPAQLSVDENMEFQTSE
jgi:Tfp pilus assembly protein PilE